MLSPQSGIVQRILFATHGALRSASNDRLWSKPKPVFVGEPYLASRLVVMCTMLVMVMVMVMALVMLIVMALRMRHRRTAGGLGRTTGRHGVMEAMRIRRCISTANPDDRCENKRNCDAES
ncbi:hypothetical protein ACWGS9_05625 [Bradyrhizobium sp. Arg314]